MTVRCNRLLPLYFGRFAPKVRIAYARGAGRSLMAHRFIASRIVGGLLSMDGLDGEELPRRWVAPELYVQASCCVVHPKPLWGKALVRTLPFVRLRHQSGFLETLIRRTDYLVSRYKWNLCQFYVSLSMLTGLCPTTGYRHGLLTNKSEGVEPSPRRTSPLPLMRNRTALLAWYRQICRYHPYKDIAVWIFTTHGILLLETTVLAPLRTSMP